MAEFVGPFAPSVAEVDVALDAFRAGQVPDVDDDTDNTLVFSHNGLWLAVLKGLKDQEPGVLQHALMHGAQLAKVSATITIGNDGPCDCCGEQSYFVAVTARSEADLENMREASETLAKISPN